jgi:hypothetical protein
MLCVLSVWNKQYIIFSFEQMFYFWGYLRLG